MKRYSYLVLIVMIILAGMSVSSRKIMAQDIQGNTESQAGLLDDARQFGQPRLPERQQQQLKYQQEQNERGLLDEQKHQQQTLGRIQPDLEQRQERQRLQNENRRKLDLQRLERQQVLGERQILIQRRFDEQTAARLQPRLEENQKRQLQQVQSRQQSLERQLQNQQVQKERQLLIQQILR